MPDTAPVLHKLPKGHNTEIGRIIVTWARLEWQLKQVAYLLLDVGPKMGRVAVREPRAVDYVVMLENLLDIHDITVNFDFKKFKKFLEVLGNHRDRLAHGIWLKCPPHRSPVLQMTKGSWQPDPDNPNKRVKRLILPEGALIRLKELQEFAPLIEQAISAAIELHQKVLAELESSPRKYDAPQS